MSTADESRARPGRPPTAESPQTRLHLPQEIAEVWPGQSVALWLLQQSITRALPDGTWPGGPAEIRLRVPSELHARLAAFALAANRSIPDEIALRVMEVLRLLRAT